MGGNRAHAILADHNDLAEAMEAYYQIAVEKGCNSNFLEDLKLAIEDLSLIHIWAIAAILGYSEEYRNGDITFSKGNETYTYPLNTLKLGNLGDNRESCLLYTSRCV